MTSATSRVRGHLWVGIAAACLAGGCGRSDELERLAVWGSVVQEGKGTFNGTVRFLPKGDGPAVAADVTDGSYGFTTENGPIAGDYEVVVTQKTAGKGVLLRQKKLSETARPMEWKFTVSVTRDKLEMPQLRLRDQSGKPPRRGP